MSSVGARRHVGRGESPRAGGVGQGRVALNLGVFLIATVLGFVVTTPAPPAPAQFERKMELLAAQGGINAVFLGSSRTHFQFIPEAFDREAGRRGLQVRSFNLGLVGAFGHELDYLLEQHVLPHTDLEFVFIEFRGFEYQCPDQRERTFREIYWHDARRTLDSITTTMRSHLGPLRWAEIQDDLMHFGLRFIGRWPEGRRGIRATDSRGYLEWSVGGEGEAKGVQPAGEALYDVNLVVNTATVLRQQRELNARGIEVFYVLPPGAPRFRELDRLESSGQVKHVLRLNDSGRHPELFTAELKGSLYLMRKGAERYSEMLAREFADAFRAAPTAE